MAQYADAADSGVEYRDIVMVAVHIITGCLFQNRGEAPKGAVISVILAKKTGRCNGSLTFSRILVVFIAEINHRMRNYEPVFICH
jgi:hypothetical protein